MKTYGICTGVVWRVSQAAKALSVLHTNIAIPSENRPPRNM